MFNRFDNLDLDWLEKQFVKYKWMREKHDQLLTIMAFIIEHQTGYIQIDQRKGQVKKNNNNHNIKIKMKKNRKLNIQLMQSPKNALCKEYINHISWSSLHSYAKGVFFNQHDKTVNSRIWSFKDFKFKKIVDQSVVEYFDVTGLLEVW